MKIKMAGALCAFAALSSGSYAAELTGGSVDLGYSAFTDNSDFARTALRGQAELGFNRNWAAQLDLGSYSFDTLGDTGTNVTLHGIFHVNDQVSLGAFYSRDDLQGGDADSIGVEAGFDLNENVAAEIYLSTGDNNGIDGNIIGFDLGYNVPDQWELSVGMDRASFDFGVDLTRLSLGAEYQTQGPTNIYAEFGSLDANAFGLGGSEPYVGVGVRLDFGADRGATFGQRGLLDMIPGL